MTLLTRARALAAALLLTIAGAPSASAALLYGIETTNDNLFTVDTGNGAVNIIGGLNVNWGFGGIDFDAGGNLFGVNSDNSLYSINKNTGQAQLVGATGAQGVLESFAIINGVGYSQDVFTNTLYTINLNNGQAQAVGAYQGGRVTGLTSDGVFLYGTRIGEQDLVRIDVTTGLIDQFIGVHGLGNDTSLAYAEGHFWTIPALNQNLYRLDFGDASPTVVHGGLNLNHVTALTAQRVPEPPVALLLLVGLAGIAAARARRA